MPRDFSGKLFYRIGEVAKITGIKSHVLRYWESEFSMLCPRKNRSGQRIYEKRDIDLICTIKELLYTQRYTIPGAHKKLCSLYSDKKPEEEKTQAEKVVPREKEEHLLQTLHEIKTELESLLSLLTSK